MDMIFTCARAAATKSLTLSWTL